MEEELPTNLEDMVLYAMQGAFKSKEVWEAEAPEEVLPLSDDKVLLQNWATMVDRQGTMLGHLAQTPSTKAELLERMPGLVNRSPAWLTARVNGERMDWRIFLTGLAQTAAVHRTAIKQVMSEQMSEPGEAERVLEETPVPGASPEEDRSLLMKGVFHTLMAHTEALVQIARDIETQLQRWAKEGGDAPPALMARFFDSEPEEDEEVEIEEEEALPTFDPEVTYKLAGDFDLKNLKRMIDELNEQQERELEERDRRRLERKDDPED